jgi:hypothetical protein
MHSLFFFSCPTKGRHAWKQQRSILATTSARLLVRSCILSVSGAAKNAVLGRKNPFG